MRALFYKRLILVIFIFLLIFVANRYISNNFLQNLVLRIESYPGGYFTSGLLTVAKYSYAFKNLSGLENQNIQLRQENSDLTSKVLTLVQITKENALLREQLRVSTRLKRDLVIAKIINIQRNPLGSSMIIDKGTNDGIKKSMAIISPGNILMGIVSEVFADTAKVVLIDDPHTSIAVGIAGSGTLATLKGALDKGLGYGVLDLITSKDIVKQNDTIVTSGLDNMPEGLLVGKISETKLGGGNLFQQVAAVLQFEPIINPLVFAVRQ